MPKARVQKSAWEVDTDSFSKAIDKYVGNKVTISNPTFQDYLQFYIQKYGTYKLAIQAMDKQLAEARGIKEKSASRQRQRLAKNPHVRLGKEWTDALGKLTVGNTGATITIEGWASYDGGQTGYRYIKFSHTLTASEMRSVITATQAYGNSGGIQRFMEIYRVPVTSWSFTKDDLSVNITPA